MQINLVVSENFRTFARFFDEHDDNDDDNENYKGYIEQVGIAAASAGGDGAWCVAEFLHARLVCTWLCDV